MQNPAISAHSDFSAFNSAPSDFSAHFDFSAHSDGRNGWKNRKGRNWRHWKRKNRNGRNLQDSGYVWKERQLQKVVVLVVVLFGEECTHQSIWVPSVCLSHNSSVLCRQINHITLIFLLTFWTSVLSLSEQIAHSTVDLHLHQISEFLHGNVINKFLLHWAVHMQ